MRTLMLFFLATAGCASSAVPGAPPPPSSVRDRLASPTRLLIAPATSTGSITARRYTPDGWQTGTTVLAIDNGELDATVAGDGSLVATAFAVSPEPIAIPASVFGQPAELTDVRLSLAGEPAFVTSWTDDDHATATATVDLDLAWSLAVGDSVTPLGTQHLTKLPVEVTLAGDGEHVTATISVHGEGTLWSWADLLELSGLELELSASTR